MPGDRLRPDTTPDGIANPPLDDLQRTTDLSPFALVLAAARRTRQITAFYSGTGETLADYYGPLVETTPGDSHTTIALRELSDGLLNVTNSGSEPPSIMGA